MNAGAYREPVLIEKNEHVEDDIGNQVAAWTEYYKGYAYMNNLSGSEYWEAAQTQAQNTIMFRLIHRGNEYNITSIDNVQFKNETIKIRATAKER